MVIAPLSAPAGRGTMGRMADSVELSSKELKQLSLSPVSLLESPENPLLNAVDWARKNVLNPALNSLGVETVNAVSNVVNAAARPTIGGDVLGKLSHLEVAPAEFLSKEWLAQSTASGLAMLVPYTIAGKFAGSALRAVGSQLALEGATANVFMSRVSASILGAAAFDFVRDARANETHLGNALGGASAFAVYELAGTATGGMSALPRILSRTLTGALGSGVQMTVSREIATGTLPGREEYIQGVITGGLMNNLLPLAQNKIMQASDQVNIAIGRGVSVDRFRGQSPLLDSIIAESPWARVLPDGKHSDYNRTTGKIILPQNANGPERLARELVRMQTGRELEKQFQFAGKLVQEGNVESAWDKYRNTRIVQETLAHHAENKVAFEMGNARQVIKTDNLAQEIGAWPTSYGMSQEHRWRFEFSDMLASSGKYRPGAVPLSKEAFTAKPDGPTLKIEPGTEAYRFREIANDAIATLQKANYIAVNAGGSVRDELMSKVPKDYDIATSALPEAVEKIFGDKGHRVITVGKQFGTIKVMIEGHTIEITTLRNDGNYTDGRRPDWITFASSLSEDAARRDLTINSIFKDPITNSYYDLFGGRADIASKKIRTVGDPEARFGEDYLRMMRVARFASRYNDFTVDAATFAAIQKNVDGIDKVKFERIRDEVKGILATEKPSVGLQLLMDSGLMQKILPEMVLTAGPKGMQDPHWHPEGSTWTHTKMVVDNLAKAGNGTNFELMFAGLLHDNAKPETQKIWPDGGISNKEHDRLGADKSRVISDRFKLSRSESDSMFDIIKLHMAMHDVKKMRESTLWKILKRDDINNLIEMQHADSRGTLHPDNATFSHKQFLLDKIDAMKNAPVPSQRLDAKPLVNGQSLIELGIPKSSIRAEIIENARLAQQEGVFTSLADGKDWVRKNYGQYLSN